jgi:hypothetical protein
MADKYFYNNAGVLTERALTVVSTGASNAGQGVALDGTGRLDNSVMPVGVGPEVKVMVAKENLAAGDWVSIMNDSAVLKARKADASTSGKPCNGFVLAAVTSSGSATVYLLGGTTNNQLSSLTLGARYYLSTTPGLGTTTAPSSSGNIVQMLGYALSATEQTAEPHDYLVLA